MQDRPENTPEAFNAGNPLKHLTPAQFMALGGNAVDSARPGYDLVSGLGTPDVDNMVRNLLILQKATR